MSDAALTKYDFEFLTGRWEGPRGAAFNECFEYCQQNGWVDSLGIVTLKGQLQIEKYKPNG